jgi:hypothetical protein
MEKYPQEVVSSVYEYCVKSLHIASVTYLVVVCVQYRLGIYQEDMVELFMSFIIGVKLTHIHIRYQRLLFKAKRLKVNPDELLYRRLNNIK